MMGPMLVRDEFKQAVEAFLAESEMPPTVFGKLALGDPGFVFGIRGTRVPSLATAEKVLEFIDQQRRDRGLPSEHSEAAQ